MKETKRPREILETMYKMAEEEIKKDNGKSFLDSLSVEQRNRLRTIVDKSESLKAVVTVLATSLMVTRAMRMVLDMLC